MKALFSVICALALLHVSYAGAASASWYYRGSAAQNGTSITLNTYDTLVLSCVGNSGNNAGAGTTGVFVVSKSAVLSKYTLTAASTGAAAMKFTPTAGTLVYDSVNGNYVGFDHIIASVSIPSVGQLPHRGYLQLLIIFVATSDAGTYYCGYVDASGTSEAAGNFAASGSFTLSVNTFTWSGSNKISRSASQRFLYSMALAGAAKVLF